MYIYGERKRMPLRVRAQSAHNESALAGGVAASMCYNHSLVGANGRERKRKKSKGSFSSRGYYPASEVWMTTTERPTGHLIIFLRILRLSKKIGWCMYVYVHIHQRCFYPIEKRRSHGRHGAVYHPLFIYRGREKEEKSKTKCTLLTCTVHHLLPLFIDLFIRFFIHLLFEIYPSFY